ncbi:N2227-like protein [Geosmithia morbida]|uniref:carnosine N-methyltransferase n=1 Tax=Geosmithia morbida TaxID=1094350 RepID=A0A9P5D2T7_9HYPO|nr:N2227-like protein [Geosmithia morbida]KAF4121816.1 N2227-like protein [Geosmithia morbida]
MDSEIGAQGTVAEGESAWSTVEQTMEDPEEMRVMFSALDSFAQREHSQYAKVAHFNVTHLRRRSFYALPQSQWQMLASLPFNFLDTLDRTDAAIDRNAELARDIVASGLRSFGLTEMPRAWVGVAKHSDIDKARSTLRQFYRDWTADGSGERQASFGPVLEALEAERSRRRRHGTAREADGETTEEDGEFKVLVPGAGLGRLVFDLCYRGFSAEGNEISYHSLLASSYILNECPSAGHHRIFPWVHSFSNHRVRSNHLRSYAVPDIHPATALSLHPDPKGSMSMCAADFLCVYGDEEHAEAYDAVATVFFLDTAPNLARYLDVVHRCLRPGGILVNVGPLLWHFENNAPGNGGQDDDGDGQHDSRSSSGIADPGSFELANDEVMALLEAVGFRIESRRDDVETPYIQDRDSMLQTVYRSSTWVARKVSRHVDMEAPITTS